MSASPWTPDPSGTISDAETCSSDIIGPPPQAVTATEAPASAQAAIAPSRRNDRRVIIPPTLSFSRSDSRVGLLESSERSRGPRPLNRPQGRTDLGALVPERRPGP